jgi:hypothetical protein
MANPATGSALLLALGQEPWFGIPGGGILGYRSRLPVKIELKGSESPSGTVNPSGFLQPGVPGPKGGTFEWPFALTAGGMLEYFEHLLGSVTKTVLETGVYQYAFTPTVSGVDTSFYCLYSTPPVEHWWFYGIKFGSLEGTIGDNQEIPLSLKGFVTHGTTLGAAVADAANTGAYNRGPFIRGVLADPDAGDVHILITRVAGGVRFKCEQTDGAPTFSGADVDVVLDPETGLGAWQNLQGADGFDLGIWDENKDPLELVLPGSPDDHALLAVGDQFTFPVTWSDPAIPYLLGNQKLTSAHWTLGLRGIGASDWIFKRFNSGKFGIERSVTPNRGSGSRYAFGVIREGELKPTIEADRQFVDLFIAGRAQRNAGFEGLLKFEGRQLGSGQHRESIQMEFPNLRIESADRTPSNANAVQEKIKLVGKTDDYGGAPVFVTVITARNWTPST